MSSPSVNKHFPRGTSPFSSPTPVVRTRVTVRQSVIDSFAAAKKILDTSYYTDIGTKRDCLNDGLVPVEERFHRIQRDYNTVFDAYEALLETHSGLVAATTSLIADVEDEHKLNAAKMQLLLQIVNATNVDSLPISRPSEPVPEAPEAEDKPAHVVTSLTSPARSARPARAEPKQKVAEIPPQQFDSEEKAAAPAFPKADARVRFQDNYPDFHDQGGDLSDAFATAVSFKTKV